MQLKYSKGKRKFFLVTKPSMETLLLTTYINTPIFADGGGEEEWVMCDV